MSLNVKADYKVSQWAKFTVGVTGNDNFEGFLARTGYLGGVRFETTQTEAWGWVRGRRLSTAAEQVLDPVGWKIVLEIVVKAAPVRVAGRG